MVTVFIDYETHDCDEQGICLLFDRILQMVGDGVFI